MQNKTCTVTYVMLMYAKQQVLFTAILVCEYSICEDMLVILAAHYVLIFDFLLRLGKQQDFVMSLQLYFNALYYSLYTLFSVQLI